MEVGVTGICYEGCGDGRNYGLHACDDGNRIDGDGCSETCEIEKDYYCRGGYEINGKDTCIYIPTELESITVNKVNDFMLRFTRPVSLFYEKRYLTDEDLEIHLHTRDGRELDLSWKSYVFEQPCSYVFIDTEITDQILGDFNKDTLVTVEVKNSKLLFDERGEVVKGSVHSPVKGHLYEAYPMQPALKAYTREWA